MQHIHKFYKTAQYSYTFIQLCFIVDMESF